MTKEEKSLLVKDLCARLPYGVIMEAYPLENPHEMTIKDLAICQIMTEPYKPYLRPMSSMTEKEHKEFDCACLDNLTLPKVRGFYLDRYISSDHLHVDWLISHHFDYRGLIPIGLALEAPKGMYK